MSETGELKTMDDEFRNETDENFDEDQENIEDRVYERLSEDVKRRIDQLNQRFSALEKQINLTLDMRMAFDNLETRYSRISEKFQTEDAKYRRQEANTEKQKDKVAQQSREARSKSRRRIIVVLLGVSLGVAAAIYYLINVNEAKNPEPSDQFTQDDADNAKKVLDQWRSEKDSDFWNSVADYVEKNNPSLQSQMTMMAYVKNWATASEVTWGPTEKGDDVETLVDAVSNGKPRDLYTTVVTVQHSGQPIERTVAADLCENALANLLAESDAGGGSDGT